MKAAAVPATWFAFILAVGCGGVPSGSDVVATFRGGQVTFDDIDAAILELPGDQRQPPEDNYAEWYQTLTRKIALQRIVLSDAMQEGLDQSPEFEKLEQDLRRRVTVGVFFQRAAAEAAPIPESELRAFYDDHRDELRSTAKRRVYHIFKRSTPEVQPEELLAEVDRLRQRIIAGEDFATLASEHSDSETRHDGGLLGWVERSRMSPDLDRIIFSLDVGVVSQPITSTTGVHLFLVAAASPERQFAFDEVRLQILNRMRAAQRSETIERIVGELPPNSFIPDPDELHALLEAGDPEACALRIGSWSMSLQEFLDRLWAAGLSGQPGGSGPQPMALINSLKRRELIYLHCRQTGLAEAPEVEHQLQRLRTRELVDFALRRRLVALAESRQHELLEHYANNRKRFSEPLRLEIERLAVPLSPRSNDDLARLEEAREALDSGAIGLQELAEELGGRVDQLGWLTPGEMAAYGGRMAKAAVQAAPGGHSTPWRTEHNLEMIRVKDRRDPRERPFEDVRSRVLADYLAHHGQDLLEEIVDSWLSDSGFDVDHERLEALHQRRIDEVRGLDAFANTDANDDDT